MDEIQSQLLDELERLERERKQEIELYENRLKGISKEYEESSMKLTKSYQDSLANLMREETQEETKLIALLMSLSNQQKEIIGLLKTPPKSEDTITKLKPILKEFFNTLETNLTDSNKELIKEVKGLLEQ